MANSCSCSLNDRVKSTTVIRLTGVARAFGAASAVVLARRGRRTCVVFLLRTNRYTHLSLHVRSVAIILPGLALQIRVYDNSARPGDRDLCTSPHPPAPASLYVKQITGNPVVAVAAVADADSAAAVVADRWMPHRQRRRKQRARSKCTLGILNSVTTTTPPISYIHTHTQTHKPTRSTPPPIDVTILILFKIINISCISLTHSLSIYISHPHSFTATRV
ncbi:hypothetical protein QTP88_025775 [Uroleucon formosanum]